MIAAIVFTVSVVMLGQFALSYWRAMVSEVARHAISDRIREAAGIAAPSVGAADFRAILSLHDLSPDLRGPAGAFRFVRAYYAAVKRLGRSFPSMSAWADVEMVTCARYVAVLVEQHLERNTACAAQMRDI